MRPALALVPLLALLLSACATTPKVAANADRSVTPQEAAASERTYDKPLQWGGVIVESRNLADSTELQVLAYPLKTDGSPDLKAKPTGRFIALHPGYLETVDYRKGRQVTVTGSFSATREGRVGEADYRFPVLQSQQLVLWPRKSERNEKPRVTFGFGVGSGGRSWGGIGIGIGF